MVFGTTQKEPIELEERNRQLLWSIMYRAERGQPFVSMGNQKGSLVVCRWRDRS